MVARSHSLNLRFMKAAEKNLKGCREACERMRNGIGILGKDDRAWDAFQLANRAMFMQRIQLAIQKKYPATFPDENELSDALKNIDYRIADTIYTDDEYAWRPFQLAFMLLDVVSVTDDSSADRSMVDLIWFPTGGGKTEAYLGLTAMTILQAVPPSGRKWRHDGYHALHPETSCRTAVYPCINAYLRL